MNRSATAFAEETWCFPKLPVVLIKSGNLLFGKTNYRFVVFRIR